MLEWWNGYSTQFFFFCCLVFSLFWSLLHCTRSVWMPPLNVGCRHCLKWDHPRGVYNIVKCILITKTIKFPSQQHDGMHSLDQIRPSEHTFTLKMTLQCLPKRRLIFNSQHGSCPKVEVMHLNTTQKSTLLGKNIQALVWGETVLC
jgi:hypothetical protein